MKEVFTDLKNKIKQALQQNAATSDRPANFQITVVTFLAMAITCITYSIIQMLS